MTSYQRREQLLAIGRSLFAAKGFEAVSVEEIAASAKVSKPIVYEHFGGKEGLYAVVVDREMQALNDALARALDDPEAHPRQLVERTALALLTYIEGNTQGFQVLVRDSPTTDPAGSFNSLLGDVSLRVEEILTESFKKQHLPTKGVPYYAQMLVGMTVFTGQYWTDRRKVGKEQLAAHIVNLAWYGLSRLEAKPELRFESDKAKKALQRRIEKEAREAQRASAAQSKTKAKGKGNGKDADNASSAAPGEAEHDSPSQAAEETGPQPHRDPGAAARRRKTGSAAAPEPGSATSPSTSPSTSSSTDEHDASGASEAPTPATEPAPEPGEAA
ncbi:MAG: TetR family transcriptional regulator [Bifidobacterium sp.]|nr:TetR family transcriptional regulator [Bifidobacterium sp.]MCH4209363.1 TetR family transcriptional regulator [Bifidobacterium sp.]MCI1225161.1 TetR family transcriptional regulator [Bifidobacterium sp.]